MSSQHTALIAERYGIEDPTPILIERFRQQYGAQPDPRLWVMEVRRVGEEKDIQHRRDAAEIKLALDCGLRGNAALRDFPSGTAVWQWTETKQYHVLFAILSLEAAAI